MEKEIFQLSQLFPSPAGAKVWQHYNKRERKNVQCFTSGVSSVLFLQTVVTLGTHTTGLKHFLGNKVRGQNQTF